MPRLLGGDISVWQDDNSTPQPVDLAKARQNGWAFVFIKTSQALWRDPDHAANWCAARQVGLLRGAYHFLVWERSPEQQADAFWSFLSADPGEIPPVVDFEWWRETPDWALRHLAAFLARLEFLCGRAPGIYTAPGFWQPHGSRSAVWRRYWLWLAHYDVAAPLVPAPWQAWHFWQYTSHGDGPRYGTESRNVDLDYFNGSLEDLRVFCGLSDPNEPRNRNAQKTYLPFLARP